MLSVAQQEVQVDGERGLLMRLRRQMLHASALTAEVQDHQPEYFRIQPMDGLCKRQQVLIEPRTKALLLLMTAGDADQALVLVHSDVSSQFHCAFETFPHFETVFQLTLMTAMT